MIEQANVAIVLENLGIGDGFCRGWEVVRANVGPILLLTLVIFVGSGILGFIIAIPIIGAVSHSFSVQPAIPRVRSGSQ